MVEKFVYKTIYDKYSGKSFFEHRIIAQEIMKGKLKSTDVVHHINEDTLDNRKENLRIFESDSDHKKAHNKIPITEEPN